MSKIKVGDLVWWRGVWGTDAPKKATVKSIELTRSRKEKEGVPVNEVDSDNQTFLVDLDNGKWAYGWQVYPVITDKHEE